LSVLQPGERFSMNAATPFGALSSTMLHAIA
jgi:hypothetical protein